MDLKHVVPPIAELWRKDRDWKHMKRKNWKLWRESIGTIFTSKACGVVNITTNDAVP